MNNNELFDETEDRTMCMSMPAQAATAHQHGKCIGLGDSAPNFSATTTHGLMKLSDYAGKWLILFSHPGDFTPVCTTEFMAFASMCPEFKKRNCCLLGLSVDSNASHLAWVNDIAKMSGIEIPFPIIEDRNMEIAKMYNMVATSTSNTSTVRNVYIICPEQKIRCILSYPMNVGRSIVEILRIVDALQISEKENVVLPANWVPGMPTLLKPPTTQAEMFERIQKPNDMMTCYSFYLCYKQNQAMPMTMPK